MISADGEDGKGNNGGGSGGAIQIHSGLITGSIEISVKGGSVVSDGAGGAGGGGRVSSLSYLWPFSESYTNSNKTRIDIDVLAGQPSFVPLDADWFFNATNGSNPKLA